MSIQSILVQVNLPNAQKLTCVFMFRHVTGDFLENPSVAWYIEKVPG